MYILSVICADCCNFRLHNITIEWIGTALSSRTRQSSLDLPYVHIWCLRISGIYQGIILCIKQSCCIAREILDFLRCKEWLIYDCKCKNYETHKLAESMWQSEWLCDINISMQLCTQVNQDTRPFIWFLNTSTFNIVIWCSMRRILVCGLSEMRPFPLFVYPLIEAGFEPGLSLVQE